MGVHPQGRSFLLTGVGAPASLIGNGMMKTNPILRVARPTNDVLLLIRFYCDGLGMTVLSRFENHEGFDGVIIGRAGAPYHLEFTKKRGEVAPHAPTADNLPVFYLPDRAAWRRAVQRLADAGFAPVRSFNSYWDRDGATFEDPDGYRVVFQHGPWDS
jgi:catechol 2,3-dioxygenase-like lactoylglutathione lyase family enzyme